jgi:hypothetical protein
MIVTLHAHTNTTDCRSSTVDNFYTPLRDLIQSASKSGFINPENLSLVSIVDLPGGEGANSDEDRAEEWGAAALKALKEFTFSVRFPCLRHGGLLYRRGGSEAEWDQG